MYLETKTHSILVIDESPADNTNIGFYIPSRYRWYFKTNKVDGWSGVIAMGWGGASELMPVTGDWDGDGVATAGFYKPSQYIWFLKNDQVSRWSNVSVLRFGPIAPYKVLAGDWQ